MHTAFSTLPPCAGIGLRDPHHREFLDSRPAIGWVEVHSENFFGASGGAVLEAVRQHTPVSLHGVGLSLGSGDQASREKSRVHLSKLKTLVDRIEPAAVSDHLCWSAVGGRYLNDLLPLPYTREALAVVCSRVDEAQDFLRRPLLVENVSSYLEFTGAELKEWDFLGEVARRTGCGILLDVNNIHVSAHNHGFDARDYLAAIPLGAVAEIHLAGHEETDGLLVDTHSRQVCPTVWALYEDALTRFGPCPSLIEWDNDIPPLAELLREAGKAQHLLDTLEMRHARAA